MWYEPENFLALITEKNESQHEWFDGTLENESKLTPARLTSAKSNEGLKRVRETLSS